MKRLFIFMATMAAIASANAQSDTTEKNDSIKVKKTVIESIASGVTNGYLLIQNGVVKGYKTMESGVVNGFTAFNDSLTIKLFGKAGETVEETKERLVSNAKKARNDKKE